MKYFLSLIFLYFIFSIRLLAQGDYNRVMAIEEVQEDFRIFKNSIQVVHPNLYLYTSQEESDSLLSEIEKKIDRTMSPLEFFRILTPYVHYIRNAHTSIRPPQPYIDHVNSQAKTLPLKLMYSEGNLIVTEVLSSQSKIKPGEVITKVNGMSVDSLMERLGKFTFVDGYNEHYSQYLSSQYLNTRYAYAIGLPDQYIIEYINSDGELSIESIEPIAWKQALIEKSSSKKKKPYSFHIINDVAVLSIRSFSLNLKPFRKFLKKSFATIVKQGVKHMIIDLRDNRGGSQEATNDLLGYFINETVFPIKEKFAVVDKLPDSEYFIKDNAFKYFHEEKLVNVNGKFTGVGDARTNVPPEKNPYEGHLISLINENCASATTSFLGQIKTHRPNALFIGRETLGNPTIVVADYIVSLNLPNSNIIVKIPLISSEKNVRFANPERGVVPDIEVKVSLDEILMKSDKIMNRAMEEIDEMKGQRPKKG